MARERKPVAELSSYSPLESQFAEPIRFVTLRLGPPAEHPDDAIRCHCLQFDAVEPEEMSRLPFRGGNERAAARCERFDVHDGRVELRSPLRRHFRRPGLSVLALVCNVPGTHRPPPFEVIFRHGP